MLAQSIHNPSEDDVARAPRPRPFAGEVPIRQLIPLSWLPALRPILQVPGKNPVAPGVAEQWLHE
jgi:hypothetical protein